MQRILSAKNLTSNFLNKWSFDYAMWYAFFQRGEAKLLLEDWEGAVEDLKQAGESSQVGLTVISCTLSFLSMFNSMFSLIKPDYIRMRISMKLYIELRDY